MKVDFLESVEFWQALNYVTSLEAPENFYHLAEKAKVSRDYLSLAINFLQVLDLDISVVEMEGELWVKPPESWPKIKIEYTLTEWLAFQAHFPFLDNLKNTPFYEILISLLGSTEKKQAGIDLFLALERISSISSNSKLYLVDEKNSETAFIREIERAIIKQSSLHLVFKAANESGRTRLEEKILPLRLCYLEGHLNLVGQSRVDSGLNCFPLSEILQIEGAGEALQKSSFGHHEIDQFLAGIRSMGGQEIRLVLKIRPGPHLSLNPPYHYLGAPYRVTNSEGEMIWAATVEPCDALYHWVASLGERAEVLDPHFFREELGRYLSRRKVSRA